MFLEKMSSDSQVMYCCLSCWDACTFETVILADDDLRFLPEFEAAALPPVFCSAGEAQ
jgi:hypothetical protein